LFYIKVSEYDTFLSNLSAVPWLSSTSDFGQKQYTVKLGYSNIGFCDTLSIASNIINIVVLIIQRYSFITTLFLGPFDDVITKFYCITATITYISSSHM
jgi:hypothetical protein